MRPWSYSSFLLSGQSPLWEAARGWTGCVARSQLSPRTILAEATADSRRLAAGWAAACFPLGSADAFVVKEGNSSCRLLSLSPAAGLPRHGWEKWGRESRCWAPPTQGWEKWGRESLCHFPVSKPHCWAPPTQGWEKWGRESLCRLLSLSPAARLPQHRGGRSGDVSPAAGLLQVHSLAGDLAVCLFALSCPGVFSCEEENPGGVGHSSASWAGSSGVRGPFYSFFAKWLLT